MSDLMLYVVVYERTNGRVSCEDSGLCLSTATSRAKECSSALLSEAKWSEDQQAWVSPAGNKVLVRPLVFQWGDISHQR